MSRIARLRRDQVTEPIKLAAARMKKMPWAIYRVRRLYCAPAEEGANPMRQTERRTLENAIRRPARVKTERKVR
jgi:hypothetical protein